MTPARGWPILRAVARRFPIALTFLLVLSLAHAWFGHDLLQGHHHRELGEASYSSPARGDVDQISALAAVLPELLFARLLVGAPGQTVEIVAHPCDLCYRDPLYLSTSLVPRPPPAV